MKKSIWVLTGCTAAFLCGFGGMKLYADYQEKEEMKRKQAAHEKAVESLEADIDESFLSCEYGGSYEPEKLVKSHTGTMEIAGQVDPMKTGDYEIRILLSGHDSYGEPAEREFLYNVTVSDTQPAEIVLSSETMEIYAGEEADLSAGVESVKDPVDGDLEYSQTEGKGKWTASCEYDSNTPGEYTVTVRAEDLSGNKSEAEYTLRVKEKPAGEAFAGNGNPYYIRINRALNTVTVYALNDSGTYEPYTAFICSTGPATPLGTYSTFNKSRWRLLYGPCYGQYVTDIVGDILFHSVPYYTQYEGDLEYYEYNKLGTAASMGCIRLCVRDALWIYNNCPIGTVVELYDDWESCGPLGRPESISIDPESPNRGWDPTDPSPANPRNQ